MLNQFESRRLHKRTLRHFLGRRYATINQGVGVAGDTGSIGGVGTGLAIDPMQAAARTSLRPLDHTSGAGGATVNGQYRVRVATTAIAPTANVVLANMRFVAASPVLLVALLRVQVDVFVVTAVTAQRADPIVVKAALGATYTASETTNATAATLTTNNGKMRTSFTITNFAANGQIAGATNAAGMTGGTSTLGTQAIGIAPCSGTVGLIGVGTGIPQVDAYRVETQAGEYPLILANNEGVQVLWGATTLATGTVIVGVTFTWAELNQY